MCTGRVDPLFVMRALVGGMDGVIICGCHLGDCHYISGNRKMLARFALLKRVLAAIGIEPERLRVEWVSAQEGDRFAAIIAEMSEQLRALGPLERKSFPAWPPADLLEQELTGDIEFWAD